jgi:CheY-like chemotaxis protein
MLVAYADRYGYHHLTAMNGQEAVEAYETATLPPVNGEDTEKSKAIVILLDINMPIMDGFEAARRIRAVEKVRSLPPATVVAVTGLGSAEALQKAHASGMGNSSESWV